MNIDMDQERAVGLGGRAALALMFRWKSGPAFGRQAAYQRRGAADRGERQAAGGY